MRARPWGAALGVLTLLIAAPEARPAPEVADPAPSAPAAPEVRFDGLLPRLEQALSAARADTGFDPVTLIEAEETAAVAEELLQEGEAEIAVQLLEQALALLPAPAPE
ncbi:MAG TPA: hypothetical protein VKU85_01300 [bacterium]|nr:hypothetical protein [bacterium]